MADGLQGLSISFFSEVLALDQKLRARLSKDLPKGMELSHFAVLNHLAFVGAERSPAQLAAALNLTKGAMTNTLTRLEAAGHIHIRPDWEDARKKQIVISPSGKAARDDAFSKITPTLTKVAETVGEDNIRDLLPVLRQLRLQLA